MTCSNSAYREGFAIVGISAPVGVGDSLVESRAEERDWNHVITNKLANTTMSMFFHMMF
jgi:hypothetical protein